jgi:hypothetical protein
MQAHTHALGEEDKDARRWMGRVQENAVRLKEGNRGRHADDGKPPCAPHSSHRRASLAPPPPRLRQRLCHSPLSPSPLLERVCACARAVRGGVALATREGERGGKRLAAAARAAEPQGPTPHAQGTTRSETGRTKGRDELSPCFGGTSLAGVCAALLCRWPLASRSFVCFRGLLACCGEAQRAGQQAEGHSFEWMGGRTDLPVSPFAAMSA